MADLIVDGVHGRYIPELFCRHYSAELERAGLANPAAEVLAGYEAGATSYDMDAADWAWDEIVSTFSTEDGATLWESPEGLFLVGADEEVPEMF